MSGRVRFKPGNGVRYGQDFGFYRGVPSGVWFRCEPISFGWKLTAPGYGERGSYGCGALYVHRPDQPTDDGGRG